MGQVLITRKYLDDLADKIREKDNDPSEMNLTEMADRIRNMQSTGGSSNTLPSDLVWGLNI